MHTMETCGYGGMNDSEPSNYYASEAAKRVGVGSGHDRRNRELLKGYDFDKEFPADQVSQILDTIDANVKGFSNELSARTGISPYLARLMFMSEVKRRLRHAQTFFTAQALAAGESKTNIAMALQVKKPTFLSQAKTIDPIADKIVESRNTGKPISIDLGGRPFVINPDDGLYGHTPRFK